MSGLVLGTLAVASLALALLPLAMILINLPLYRPPAPARCSRGLSPRLSLLIPARNEAANIGAAVTAALASRDVDLELIVLDDESSDGTAAIVAGFAALDRRVRLERAPPLPQGWSGKAHACQILATLARHELLVFQDADVRLAPDALIRIVGFIRAGRAALVSGFPWQRAETVGERLIVPLILFILLGYLPMGLMRRRGDASLAAGCGQLVAVDRRAYERVGGHGAIRASLHDGITLPRAFRRAGFHTDLFDASNLAECRMYHSWAETWAGFAKNAHEGMATPRALPVWTLLLGGGQLLPCLLLAAGPLLGTASWVAAIAALAALSGIAARLILARRFRQSVASALLHPLGVLLLLAIQVQSLWRQHSHRQASWRGRSYDTGEAQFPAPTRLPRP